MNTPPNDHIETSQLPVQSNAPGVAIVAWLTYAFWGWAAVATAALVAIAATFSLQGYSSDYEGVAYVIAATLVVLPIALICDIVFSKHEQNKKVGIGAVIMVIHAVLFALLCVGALITVLFSLVSLVLSDSSDVTGQIVTAITGSVLVLFYALLFLRTIRPVVGRRTRLVLRSALTAIVVLAIIWGIVGPAVQTFIRKDDQRATTALESVRTTILEQVMQNNALPASSEELINASVDRYGVASQQVIREAFEDGLISYTPNTRPSQPVVPSVGERRTEVSHFYKLCVTYKHDDKNRDTSYGYSSSSLSGEVPTTIDRLSTKAGETCYDLRATGYQDIEASADGINLQMINLSE